LQQKLPNYLMPQSPTNSWMNWFRFLPRKLTICGKTEIPQLSSLNSVFFCSLVSIRDFTFPIPGLLCVYDLKFSTVTNVSITRNKVYQKLYWPYNPDPDHPDDTQHILSLSQRRVVLSSIWNSDVRINYIPSRTETESTDRFSLTSARSGHAWQHTQSHGFHDSLEWIQKQSENGFVVTQLSIPSQQRHVGPMWKQSGKTWDMWVWYWHGKGQK